MKRKYEEEITANLERAETSIRAAKDLLAKDYYDFTASRAYYAAFYAATAVLLCEELEFGKHSGVIAFIHREFVKTGKLDKKYGQDLNWLFELRGVGDYGATIHVSQQDAEKAIKVAEEFLEAIEKLIQGKVDS
jgi:uncharacterized protein (UPF0332 family)